MPEPSADVIDAFISKWSKSGGHERGAGHHFLLEFCELLGLPHPDPPVADNALNSYTFERRVERRKADGTTTPNWIDLYKAGHFVLETKQGVNPNRDKSHPDQPLLPSVKNRSVVSGGHGKRGSAAFDRALIRAHSQAERYIRAIPAGEGRPPFLIVCDIGHSFDFYAEFTGTGGQYERFPDPRSHRVMLKELHQQTIRDRFRKIWTDPHSLDPSKRAAAVTREVARTLADLAKSLEEDGHDPDVTAGFLQRCLFTMFAEDVDLLPKNSFLNLLRDMRGNSSGLVTLLHGLWQEMNTGEQTGSTFSSTLRATIPYFNGGLFEDTTAIPLRTDQIAYLIHAAEQDWSAVEPAIFGTLLERALDPRERHKLGAHYTPRSYVERLVRRTIIEPLREKWEAVKTAAAQLDEQGNTAKARDEVAKFHHQLAATRILDPACGSGNFLYVSLELLKRLEAEVLDLFESLGGNKALEMDTVLIRPKNFLGIEVNPRAAAIAQIVLWIGYFQWHKRTTGKADTNDRPLLPKTLTIKRGDAILDYDKKTPRLDDDEEIVTIWDGQTTKLHPVTGRKVPDESCRSPVFDFQKPRRAEWPPADYVVGNPPFLGNKRMREGLGDGYVDALRKAWRGSKPDSWDFVMFWWQKAAELLISGDIQRFGFITTNSITQPFNRRVLEKFLGSGTAPLHVSFAIADHPWVDAADGADVRIAMTVAAPGLGEGMVCKVLKETRTPSGEQDVLLAEAHGVIASNLKLGADVTSAVALTSNDGLANQGVTPLGLGFRLEADELASLGLDLNELPPVVRPYAIGRDIVRRWEDKWIIDFFELSEQECQDVYPRLYQRVFNTVRPERLAKASKNKDTAAYAARWWQFAKPREKMRPALRGLPVYIGTCRTAKHRLFSLLPGETVPDAKIVAIAIGDTFHLGVLSSSVHSIWAERTGVRMGVGNDLNYNHADCFNKFPFPAVDEGPLKQRIRGLGDKLDTHRKARQAAHPDLTLTGMYNVLEKLRDGTALTENDQKIHDQGFVTILKKIHDDLDAAVFEAYGWQRLHRALTVSRKGERRDEIEQELLTHLVALNHVRAAEEKHGRIRWLRPEYQTQDEAVLPKAKQKEIELISEETTAIHTLKWPTSLPDQVAVLHKLLPVLGEDPSALAAIFGRRTKARIAKITEILETLRTLGKL